MKNVSIKDIKEKLENFIASKENDVFSIEAIKEAICSAESGNYGIGAVLVDESTNKILERGHNKIFTEYRSDFHAEMDLLNKFETKNGKNSRSLLKNLTLYTSLEPCPMCLCRIITSGVSKIFYIANDIKGGMVHLHNQLPITWQEISKNRTFQKSDCSKELSKLSFQIYDLTSYLDQQLKP